MRRVARLIWAYRVSTGCLLASCTSFIYLGMVRHTLGMMAMIVVTILGFPVWHFIGRQAMIVDWERNHPWETSADAAEWSADDAERL